MDGVAFFSGRLEHLPLRGRPVPHGLCTSHNQPADLFEVNGNHICRGCALLRQTYTTSKGKSRLSLGSYMLLTTSGVDYCGNHILPAPIRCQSATGALRSVTAKLILTPPSPPWMFVAFARSNPADRLFVTVSNDLIFFSGKFLFPGSIDEPSVERLNRAQVMELLDVGALTREEWERICRSHAALNSSPDALVYLQEIYRRYPRLARVAIPTIKTPEFHAIRLLAEVNRDAI